jgi:hypothetical protein
MEKRRASARKNEYEAWPWATDQENCGVNHKAETADAAKLPEAGGLGDAETCGYFRESEAYWVKLPSLAGKP